MQWKIDRFGLFVQASFRSLSIFFFSSVERIRSMDSSSTKDMDSVVISGDTLAAEDLLFQSRPSSYVLYNYLKNFLCIYSITGR